MRQTWEKCKKCPFFHRRASKIKRTRWLQFASSSPELNEWYSTIELGLLVYALTLGLYASINATPLVNNILADLDGEIDDDAPVHEDEDEVQEASSPIDFSLFLSSRGSRVIVKQPY